MAKRGEWNMKVTAPMSRVFKHPSGYLEGCVITSNGIVYAYSQGGVYDGVKQVPHTTLQFVYDRRLYTRNIGKRYTQRGLATIANRFAGDVIYG